MNASTNYRSAPIRLVSLSAAVLLGLTLTLSGCGDGLAGEKYVDENGSEHLEFKSDNKVYMTFMGSTAELSYSVDDDKILLDTRGMGKVVLTRYEDGTLTGLPMTGTLKKKEE